MVRPMRKCEELAEARRSSTSSSTSSSGKLGSLTSPTTAGPQSSTVNGLTNNRARLLHSRSNTDSPRSIDSTRSRQVFSPLRTPRNVQSPSLDSGDEGSLRIERGTYSYMFQDIVSIKTMLLKLKRVLQESEPLNPFDSTVKNGLFYNLNDGNATTEGSLNEERDTIVDELADLRRQVVLLQGQVDEKDREILGLQEQLEKYQKEEATNSTSAALNGKDEPREMTNAATQTDKLRPLSTASSFLQDHGSGSLVSSNDSWMSEQQRPTAPASEQQHQQLSPITSSNSSSRSTSRRSSAEHRPSRLRPPTAIPSPRKLGTPTLIPRAVSATGRAHNS